jgi:precorrin-6B methylase 2
MEYLVRLKHAYSKYADLEIVTGLNPLHFAGFRDAFFTHYSHKGASSTPHLGISLWEIFFLEKICRFRRPGSIYIVGNGLGWSALALAYINPEATVIAIDPSSGIEITNRIANEEKLDCRVIQAVSPEDNKRIIDTFGRVPEIVLIDGNHTNDQVVKDFESIFSICNASSIYIFHDIINFELIPGIEIIAEQARKHGMKTRICAGTPSGMAIVYSVKEPQGLAEIIDIFAPRAEELRCVAAAGGALCAWIDAVQMLEVRNLEL